MPDFILNDGLLRFKIRNTETGEESPHALDVLLLRLTCEECETTHSLPVNDRGEYKANAAFLADLASRIVALGVPDCTASMAFQLWGASANAIDSLKKNTNDQPNSPSGLESSQPEEPTELATSNAPADQSPPNNASG